MAEEKSLESESESVLVGGGGAPAAPGSVLDGTPAPAEDGEKPPAAPKPEWLEDRYVVSKDDGEVDLEKSAEKLATGYAELRTKLSEKHAALGKPEPNEDGKVKYEFKAPEGVQLDFEPDSIEAEAFTEIFEKYNLSQAVVSELVAAQSTIWGARNEATRDGAMADLREAGFTDQRLAEVSDFFAKTLAKDVDETVLRAATAPNPSVVDVVQLLAGLRNAMLRSNVAEKNSADAQGDLRAQLDAINKKLATEGRRMQPEEVAALDRQALELAEKIDAQG